MCEVQVEQLSQQALAAQVIVVCRINSQLNLVFSWCLSTVRQTSASTSKYIILLDIKLVVVLLICLHLIVDVRGCEYECLWYVQFSIYEPILFESDTFPLSTES